MRAYSELYIYEFQDNLGEMLDYIVDQLGIPMKECWDRFLASGIAREIERGNPDFLVGKTGTEVAQIVLESTGCRRDPWPHYVWTFPKSTYWTGWALAYLQWYTGMSFAALGKYGYDFDGVRVWFNPYHEADISKFADDAVTAIRNRMQNEQSALKRYRSIAGLTQQKLAELSGVNIRMIRAYEQKKQDISKAEAASVIALAKVLRCDPSNLVVTL